MADYILSCCSTADLSKEHFDSREIHYICFHFMLDGVDYPDDLGVSVPFDEFYRRMAEGSDTRTSQVNVSEYVEYFTPFLEAGKDVLHVSLSGGVRGGSPIIFTATPPGRAIWPRRCALIERYGRKFCASSRSWAVPLTGCFWRRARA